MKLLTKIVIFALFGLVGICSAQLEISGSPTIYNETQEKYFDANDISDPIRDGAYTAIQGPDNTEDTRIGGILGLNDKIETHADAKEKTLTIIKNLINYALGLVSLIALIYLIYHGIIILTAAGDDAKYKQGMKGVKFAAIALIGIGLSWIIVSSIFWLINAMASGDYTL